MCVDGIIQIKLEMFHHPAEEFLLLSIRGLHKRRDMRLRSKSPPPFVRLPGWRVGSIRSDPFAEVQPQSAYHFVHQMAVEIFELKKSY